MFEATHWEMAQLVTENHEISSSSLIVKPKKERSVGPAEGIDIVHQFPFSSSLQRMSVVTQEVGQDKCVAFMKGAPEMVIKFCKEDSIPKGFSQELQFYTMKGFRVIALAYKTLDENIAASGNFLREDIESNLEFLGLLILENRLKPETKPVLQELSAANIRTVMITGDNLQTAITVSRTSGLIPLNSNVILVEAEEPLGQSSAKITWHPVDGLDQSFEDTTESVKIEMDGRTILEEAQGNYHFAMSGKTYQVVLHHFQSLLPKLLVNGAIFARMSPGQKSSLIEEFQKLDYYVCMCGDGANDCGALKVAHAGISLSEQEASVASPFTSHTPNIGCIPQLIKEGRAALVTSFCVFKYMTLYAMIQFVCLLLLYWQINILSNYQLLIQDVAVTIVVCLTMSLNHAYPKLAPYRPPAQLMSPPLLLSVVLHTLFTIAMQVFGFIVVQQQPWYTENPETTCIYGNVSFMNVSEHNVTTNTQLSFQLNMSHKSYETTTLWPLTTIHCIIVAFVFSKGKPFRQPIYTNYAFSAVLLAQMGVCIFLLFADIQSIYSVMEIVCTPTSWRITIFITLVITIVVSVIAEELIIENRKLWLLIKRCFNYKSKSKYRKIIRDVEMDQNWPPINRKYCTKPVNRHEASVAYNNPAFEYN